MVWPPPVSVPWSWSIMGDVILLGSRAQRGDGCPAAPDLQLPEALLSFPNRISQFSGLWFFNDSIALEK